MRFFGKIFVEYWDNGKWNLCALPWYQYLYGRICGIIGNAESSEDYRHVPRSKIHFET